MNGKKQLAAVKIIQEKTQDVINHYLFEKLTNDNFKDFIQQYKRYLTTVIPGKYSTTAEELWLESLLSDKVVMQANNNTYEITTHFPRLDVEAIINLRNMNILFKIIKEQ